MKKLKVNKLALQKVKISHLKGGAETQNAAAQAAEVSINCITWKCKTSVWCTYSCLDEYSCDCDAGNHTVV